MGHTSFFHTSSSYQVLFSGINVNSPTACSLACLILFLLAVVYNALKCWRKYIMDNRNHKTALLTMFSPIHLVQSVLYVIQFVGGYILMLVVMTYNVWLIAAVMAGFGVGYFLFGWNEFLPSKKQGMAYDRDTKPQQELQPLTQNDKPMCLHGNDVSHIDCMM